MLSRVRVADVPALAAAAFVGLYGAYLVFLGPVLTFVAPDGPTSMFRQPNPVGFALIAAGLLVWVGVTGHQDRRAWLGAAITSAISVFFVFGVGGVLIPVSVALLIALAYRSLSARRSTAR